ncbi:MAG: hypothetical protein IPG67_10265 [Acidobacteria bacterium]|nr:hypothetical protein [Acidobacteriota bacterium]
MKSVLTFLLFATCFGCSTPTTVEQPKVDRLLTASTPVPTSSTPVPEIPSQIGSEYTAKDIEAKLGIVSLTKTDLVCLRILNASLRPSDEFYAVVPNERPHVIHKLRIKEKVPTSCVRGSSDMPDSELITSRTSYYLAEFLTSNDELSLIFGIAVVGISKAPTLAKGVATAELTGAPPAGYFRECTGNESILYAVWSGKPQIGKRIWNRAIYLEYGTVPTCTKKDYQGIDE